MRTHDGIPSFTDRIRTDPQETQQLRKLASLDTSDSLESVFEAHRAGRLDERVVDRFFKRRTVSWRVLVEEYCSGRGLVVGSCDEVVSLAFAELLESVWVADTDLAALETLAAVDPSDSSTVRPIHASIPDLPFPASSFDLVVLQCSAGELPTAPARVADLLAPDGRLVLVVDGWTRELGLASKLGMTPAREAGIRDRIGSAARAAPAVVSRQLSRHDLGIERTAALLSRGKHENELAFDVESSHVLQWLLHEFDATTSMDGFDVVRHLARLAQGTGVLGQSYPRYLYVCGRSPVDDRSIDTSTDAVLVAGKNRTTVLQLEDGRLDHVRKVPNSRRHAGVNEAAERATLVASSVNSVSSTIPDAETRTTPFGPERIEQPVQGVPLDQVIDRDPERFERCLNVAFDWLERLHVGTRSGTVQKEPADVVSDLTAERFGLTDPPGIDQPMELPQVLTHGDYFGSNIYVDTERADWDVTGVIDWEWARTHGNPIVDAGYFVLQLATCVGGGFQRGFDQVILEETAYSQVLYEQIGDYCASVGINPGTFGTYLPIGLIERSRADAHLNGRLDIDWPTRVQYIWGHQHELMHRLTAVQAPESSR